MHPQKLLSKGMPQGCPLSPLMMAIWVSAGVRSVRNQTNDNSRYVCYMDDRSFWCPDVTTMETHVEAWHAWSQAMGLKENHAKTCAVGRGRTKVSLQENHPEWAAEEIKILGVCTISKPRANTQQENDRLTAAKKRQLCFRRPILAGFRGLRPISILSNLRLLSAGVVGIHPKKTLIHCSTS